MHPRDIAESKITIVDSELRNNTIADSQRHASEQHRLTSPHSSEHVCVVIIYFSSSSLVRDCFSILTSVLMVGRLEL